MWLRMAARSDFYLKESIMSLRYVLQTKILNNL